MRIYKRVHFYLKRTLCTSPILVASLKIASSGSPVRAFGGTNFVVGLGIAVC